ncbi:MAG: secretin N-terminal domain-containing protein, partial [Pyrinomonadaceae bacterium]
MKVSSCPLSRMLMSVMVMFCLLLSSVTVMAKKGEKNYKRGLEYEATQQWELAMQEFAMAMDANPTDVSYQLHYHRAIVNASQEFMKQGQTLVQKRDFIAAHGAFRKALGYDPTNDLARVEMDRMVKLQSQFLINAAGVDVNGNVQPTPALFQTGRGQVQGQSRTGSPGIPGQSGNQDPTRPLRDVDQKRTVIYSDDLKSLIRTLADPLELTVIFDSETFKTPRKVEVDYRNVTWAQALDNLFLQEGLFFQKTGPHTILVASQARRYIIQEMSVRTYYLKNSDPAEVLKVIQIALPPQQGRQSVIAPNKASNSITVRDTPENLRLVESIIRSLDKDRAEVMMDVKIYEVSQTDLLQFGNQLGSSTTLTNLGGVQTGFASLFGSGQVAQQALASVPTALGAALLVPASNISALQDRKRTRLLYSTQVHAFDGAETTTRIGQSVPVQTAQAFPFGSTQSNINPIDPNNALNPGLGFGGGFPVFNYEDTGLTLKFTPQIFPDSDNHDVQVKMSIESKDIDNPGSLTPSFTQRTITGTARIPNNTTIMMASVSQNKTGDSRTGLPLVGLVPILGRLFTVPRKDNTQTDIVITVTPRVLRAPVVIEGDEEMFDSGTSSAPPAA